MLIVTIKVDYKIITLNVVLENFHFSYLIFIFAFQVYLTEALTKIPIYEDQEQLTYRENPYVAGG